MKFKKKEEIQGDLANKSTGEKTEEDEENLNP